MKRLPLLSALFLALVGLGVWLVRGGAPRGAEVRLPESGTSAEVPGALPATLAEPARAAEALAPATEPGRAQRVSAAALPAPACIAGRLRLPPGEELPEGIALDDVQLDWRVPSSRRVETRRVAGKIVEVERWNGDRHITFADADGAFEYSDVGVGVPLELHVAAGGPTRVFAIPPLAPGERRQLEVELDLGATLSGWVRDEHGQAVEGVSVVLAPLAAGAGPTADVEPLPSLAPLERPADAEGRFVFRGLERRLWGVGVVDFEARVESPPIDLARGSVRDLVLVMPQGGVVRGNVEWSDGTPATWVALEVDGAPASRRLLEEGRFVVTHLGSAARRIVARGQRDGELGIAEALEVLPDGPPVRLVLQPVPRHTLRGRVVDLRGAAVPRCKIEARSSDSPHREGVQSDEDGLFEIRLAEGEWTLFAVAAGFLDTKVTSSVPSASALSIVLHPTVRVHGRVLDPAGAPVAEALVRAGRQGDRTESAEDGAFVIELREPDAEIRAWKRGFAASDPFVVTPAAGSFLEDVVLRLAPGCWLAGRVLDEHGAPVPAVEVRVGDRSTETDEGGEFLLDDLRSGAARVRAIEHRTGRRAFAEVVLAGERTATVELRLRGLDPVHLRVRIERGGQPLPADLALRSPELSLDGSAGADGRVELVLPYPGRLDAWVLTPDRDWRVTLEIPPGAEHELVLELEELPRADSLDGLEW